MAADKVRSAGKKESRFFYGYVVVISAFVIMILAYGVRTSFGVFFIPLEDEFKWSRTLISGAATLSMLIQGVWGIYMGRVNDKAGSRLVITICCFFTGLGILLMAVTHYSWQLYIFYGLIVGVGMGGVFVALLSTVTRWFVKRRGLMTGIVLAGIGVGTVTLAPVSNWLISIYGWRLSNVIIGGTVLIIGVLAAQFLRRNPAKVGQPTYDQTERKEPAAVQDAEGISLKKAAVTWQFWSTWFIFALLGYCTFTITIHLVPHITDLGISAATAAAILAVTGGVSSIGGILLGLLADKIGNRNVIIISLILVSAALLCLVQFSSVMMFYLFAIVYSLGIGGGTAMESTITADLFGMKAHGAILGFISFGFTVGGAIGPLLTGYLFDLNENYTMAFIVCAVIGIIGIILTSILKPVKKPESRVEP
jgi:MFS family permease